MAHNYTLFTVMTGLEPSKVFTALAHTETMYYTVCVGELVILLAAIDKKNALSDASHRAGPENNSLYTVLSRLSRELGVSICDVCNLFVSLYISIIIHMLVAWHRSVLRRD